MIEQAAGIRAYGTMARFGNLSQHTYRQRL
jgi:hypothetical protein